VPALYRSGTTTIGNTFKLTAQFVGSATVDRCQRFSPQLKSPVSTRGTVAHRLCVATQYRGLVSSASYGRQFIAESHVRIEESRGRPKRRSKRGHK
jgi:hypothetical protein